MAKGKKFDAAEKHFMKKETVYKKEIAAITAANHDLRNQLETANNKINDLEQKNAQLEDWVARLLEYTELTPDELKKAVEANQAAVKSLKMLELIGNFMGLR